MNLECLELSQLDEEKLVEHLKESGMSLPFVWQLRDRFRNKKISELSSSELTDLVDKYAKDAGMGAFAIDPMQPYSELVLRLLKWEIQWRLKKKSA